MDWRNIITGIVVAIGSPFLLWLGRRLFMWLRTRYVSFRQRVQRRRIISKAGKNLFANRARHAAQLKSLHIQRRELRAVIAALSQKLSELQLQQAQVVDKRTQVQLRFLRCAAAIGSFNAVTIAKAVRCSEEEAELLISDAKTEGLIQLLSYIDLSPFQMFAATQGNAFYKITASGLARLREAKLLFK